LSTFSRVQEERKVTHVKHRVLVLLAGAVGLVAVLASLSVATASTTRTAGSDSAAATMKAPKVPNAAALKGKYRGQSITFVGDSVGGGHQRDTALATEFTKDTGIKVKVVPHP